MTDNITLNVGTGGETLASNDIGGVQYQRLKMTWGADGVSTDVSAAAPLPISDAGGSITIDGTIDLGATDNTALNAIVTNTAAPLAAGTNNIGDVDVLSLPSIPTGSNTIGIVGLSDVDNAVLDTIATNTAVAVPDVSIGYSNIDLDEADDEIKATAGVIYWISVTNSATTPRYLQLYNATAANVTVGTTPAQHTFLIPSQGDANGAGFMLPIPHGLEFTTAITVAATTGVDDAGAPGANEVICNIGYA